MCGIIGIIEPRNFNTIEDVLKLIKRTFKVNRHRGEDSYGCLLITNDFKFKIVKGLTIEDFENKFREKTEELKVENIKLIIAHHRKATLGEINLKLQHPVIVKNNKNSIYIFQNGTKSELLDIAELDSKKYNDTYAIGTIYLDLKPYQSNIRFNVFSEIINKAGVVFIIDKKRLIYFHKDNSRQLWFNEKLNIFVSEPITEDTWRKFKSLDYQLSIDEFINLFNDKKELDKILDKETQFYKRKCIYCGNEFYTNEEYSWICKSCKKNYTYTGKYYNSTYTSNSVGVSSTFSTYTSKFKKRIHKLLKRLMNFIKFKISKKIIIREIYNECKGKYLYEIYNKFINTNNRDKKLAIILYLISKHADYIKLKTYDKVYILDDEKILESLISVIENDILIYTDITNYFENNVLLDFKKEVLKKEDIKVN